MAPHSNIFARRNPIDRGAWWAKVHEVSKSQTRLSDWACEKKAKSKLSFTGSMPHCSCSELSTMREESLEPLPLSKLESHKLARDGMGINMGSYMLCNCLPSSSVPIYSGLCSSPSCKGPILMWDMARSPGSIIGNREGGAHHGISQGRDWGHPGLTKPTSLKDQN